MALNELSKNAFHKARHGIVRTLTPITLSPPQHYLHHLMAKYRNHYYPRHPQGGATVPRAVGTLVGAAHLTDIDDVQFGGVEDLLFESLWREVLVDARRPVGSVVGHQMTPEDGPVETLREVAVRLGEGGRGGESLERVFAENAMRLSVSSV